jgi:hypothetical protein
VSVIWFVHVGGKLVVVEVLVGSRADVSKCTDFLISKSKDVHIHGLRYLQELFSKKFNAFYVLRPTDLGLH